MGLRDVLKDRLSVSGWIKDALFGGIGAVAIAMTYQLFEVIKQQPELLAKWGPNFMLWLLGIAVIGILANQMVDALKEGSKNLVESTRASVEAQTQNAEGMRQMASAMHQIADQGDGQMREVQAQVAYVATEIGRVHDRLTQQDEMMAEIRAAQVVQKKEGSQ